MIKTSTQLKAKVRNLSGSDSFKAQTLIRNFIMERFLERISLSSYRNNFILKGGMLVSAIVGLDMRATMDVDTTVRSMTLSIDSVKEIVEEIITIDAGDGVEFKITKITNIMEEFDYPGIRIALEASLDRLRQVIRLDVSTADIITPAAIEFSYKLMYEERSILLYAYNIIWKLY
ncbi:hypothetical protein M2150_000930 [Lachnospiraceae bacterium PM6-15]|uniref:nucleotidyl transferase AbiEii/AbiGii toxin family protein n=1 Tax=Ohessyouella blattaphilus TaxID=2949333 RepID=UPI003E21707F